jgi:cytochrome c peroxidase
MTLARKLKRGSIIIALGVQAGLMPGLAQATPVDPAIMARIGPRKADASKDKEQLIRKGRNLFLKETFGGNGRTCATCHPPTNNFTLDVEFIENLPDDDPLFVAEFNPDLAELENPEIMRRFALILENLDGFDRPGVFRGVPHTLALPTSIKVSPDGDADLTRADGSTVAEATGWSGDGAPGGGSLREFAVGAIIQHFPKTLSRTPGEDFRLPTAEELDALEAFQLSLGRQEELDLAAIDFYDPAVRAGKDLFEGIGVNRGCTFCHSNAGGSTAEGMNRNFATNTASMTQTPARKYDPGIPGDGGFDAGPQFNVPGIEADFYGNATMNTPPLVEAADSGPFFHNNAAATIEDAIAFYTTRTFSSDDPFVLSRQQINRIGAFLRTLNALENVRNAREVLKEAEDARNGRGARQRIEVVMADTEDAIEVLNDGPLGPLYADAITYLEDALGLAQDAYDASNADLRNAALEEVNRVLKETPPLILR